MEKGKRVIALGFFDGVHKGHGALLNVAKSKAQELGVRAAVLSFDVPPGKTIDNKPVPMINSPLDRAYLMKHLYGIDDRIFLHFDDELRHMEWWRFLEWLKSDFGAVHLVAGYDFRFGYKGEGTVPLLLQKCAELGIGCDIVEKVAADDLPISSTRIRELLIDGQCEKANELLGHYHILSDVVRYGYRLGRKLGTPTINMRFEDGVLVPRHGVYVAKAHILETGDCYNAVTNVGVRPTVSGSDAVSVESHLLGFSGNLYGQGIRIEFFKFLRPEIKFDCVEDLRDQIRRDAAETQSFFNEQETERIDPFDYPDWKQN
jgi:riboflavin kinase/FMN adenylyltransferase